jgi:hypothetical protein
MRALSKSKILADLGRAQSRGRGRARTKAQVFSGAEFINPGCAISGLMAYPWCGRRMSASGMTPAIKRRRAYRPGEKSLGI